MEIDEIMQPIVRISFPFCFLIRPISRFGLIGFRIRIFLYKIFGFCFFLLLLLYFTRSIYFPLKTIFQKKIFHLFYFFIFYIFFYSSFTFTNIYDAFSFNFILFTLTKILIFFFSLRFSLLSFLNFFIPFYFFIFYSSFYFLFYLYYDIIFKLFFISCISVLSKVASLIILILRWMIILQIVF